MNDGQPNLSERFTEAMALARDVHCRDVRKGTEIPYLSHLMSVSALVLEHGGSEDQAIAGLLHDAAEDHGGQSMIDTIRVRFGDDVAAIVAACTDSLTEDPHHKLPWWLRKVAYVDHLESADSDALLVSAADKLHNSRCILADYRLLGDELWSRFNPDARRVGSLWYYGRLSAIFSARLGGSTPAGELAAELERTVIAIRLHAAARGHDVDQELREGRLKEEQARLHTSG
jgi:hypothetical protein